MNYCSQSSPPPFFKPLIVRGKWLTLIDGTGLGYIFCSLKQFALNLEFQDVVGQYLQNTSDNMVGYSEWHNSKYLEYQWLT